MTALEQAIKIGKQRFVAHGPTAAFNGLQAGLEAADLARLLADSKVGKDRDDLVRVATIAAFIAVQTDRLNRTEHLFPYHAHNPDQLTFDGSPGPRIDSYSYFGEQLRTARTTPHWRQLKLAASVRAGNKCERCWRSRPHLQLHHTSYVRLGHESLNDVELVCDDCHRKAHALIPRPASDRSE
jgi:hypothetical protein